MEPQIVFDCFKRVNQIPRPSKREEKMIAFLQEFGQSLGLPTKVDKTGNVLISKPATPGMENKPTVVLQSHMDMVCEKNADRDFNFDTDPIETYIEGDWMHAKGTTLGADDGIGVAMQMAVLMSNDIEHGPLECLFTRDEETGLTGAEGLESGFMTGQYLINLDSEDEGQIFVSCAGGVRTEARFQFKEEEVPAGYFTARVGVKGLHGGHSGDDINKKFANANKLLVRYLCQVQEETDLRLVDIQSGGLHNAIPREGWALIAVPMAYKETLRVKLNVLSAQVEEEFSATEPTIEWTLESLTDEQHKLCIEKAVSDKMLRTLHCIHNGVFAMSQDLDWLVETSSNLASIHKIEGGEVVVTTSQRSSVPSNLEYMASVIRTTFELGGAKTLTNEGYPGWKMNPKSEILRIAKESYVRLFNKEPEILAIHAGLECGLFSEKYPGLDMISVGPTLRGVHSPDERLLIPTVKLVWEHLLDILKHV
ncbi:MAG: aminoacyl-histidine dipeptidase [Bacteroidaceae bacterium]|nr:aminoacyl-histidine dipeptidase [Bacteroidaceae bacterium]